MGDGERKRIGQGLRKWKTEMKRKNKLEPIICFLSSSWNVFSASMHLAAFAQNVINKIKQHKTLGHTRPSVTFLFLRFERSCLALSLISAIGISSVFGGRVDDGNFFIYFI